MLAKAITLAESRKAEHRLQAEELLNAAAPFSGNSIRIGITGVPGVGKSTFIENFGKYAISKGKKVAVLAVDPSSNLNKGSILGDKTRMEELSKDPNAFIRPSPSAGFLGGVANTTYETMLLCEAAGFDIILIETVGVGQSEVLVSDMTDIFLFLKIIGGGDELQGIKRGIMEMADLIFINKVDDENRVEARRTRAELLRALHFMSPKEDGWKVPVLMGAAISGEGLDEAFNTIETFINLKKQSGSFEKIRKLQNEKRFEFWVQQLIRQKTEGDSRLRGAYQLHKKNASDSGMNPSSEARNFVEKFLKIIS